MNNIVLNIMKNKNNLSIPIIFSKIAKYYWNRDTICEYLNCTPKEFATLCLKNKWFKFFKFFKSNNLLKRACKKGDFKIVKYLVENGAIIDASMLWLACSYNRIEIVNYLFEKVNIQYEHLVYLVCRKNYSEIFKYIVGKIKTDYLDYNHMIYLVCSRGCLDILKILINDINLNLKNEGLKIAILYRQLEIVKFLVENGATAHITDGIKDCNNPEIITYLINNGANVKNDRKLFSWACRTGRLEIVKILIEKGVDIQDISVIRTSMRRGRKEVVKYLIEKGADVNSSFLRWAYTKNHSKFIKFYNFFFVPSNFIEFYDL